VTTPPADVCTGGSEPQPLFSVAIALGPAALGRLLPRGSSWVETFLFAFGVTLNFSGSIFCVSGPPADPQLTGPELAEGLEQLANGEQPTVLPKLIQFCERFVWYAFCQCTNGQPPVPVADIPAPPDVPLINPNPPVLPPTAQACQTNAGTPFVQNGDSAAVDFKFFAGLNPTTLQVHFSPPQPGGSPLGGTMEWQFRSVASSVGTIIGSHLVTVPASGVIADFVTSIPAGAQSYGVFCTGNGDGSTSGFINYDTTESLYCGTSPGQPLDLNCCPPDPAIMDTLNQILQLIRGIHGTTGPTSWVDGAVHGTLSGSGSFVLAGPAIGIRVDMVTLPSGTRVGPGVPTFFWDAGFVTPIALTSPLRGQRLVFEHESMTLPNFTDSVGYTLLNGTTVTITELLPVPG
jgi:hypothetical protein